VISEATFRSALKFLVGRGLRDVYITWGMAPRYADRAT
jgi:hypothetical protein